MNFAYYIQKNYRCIIVESIFCVFTFSIFFTVCFSQMQLFFLILIVLCIILIFLSQLIVPNGLNQNYCMDYFLFQYYKAYSILTNSMLCICVNNIRKIILIFKPISHTVFTIYVCLSYRLIDIITMLQQNCYCYQLCDVSVQPVIIEPKF